ncbi:unnamed protein product [Mesocestoides corti]|uniref:Uncharacterized protein n=1 Tax=Mesocestoides corti TaxID=53468 RepID=A0A0R3UR20_MESCO|nr:unnamed protein product [Mesocestoides corti]
MPVFCSPPFFQQPPPPLGPNRPDCEEGRGVGLGRVSRGLSHTHTHMTFSKGGGDEADGKQELVTNRNLGDARTLYGSSLPLSTRCLLPFIMLEKGVKLSQTTADCLASVTCAHVQRPQLRLTCVHHSRERARARALPELGQSIGRASLAPCLASQARASEFSSNALVVMECLPASITLTVVTGRQQKGGGGGGDGNDARGDSTLQPANF